MPGSDENCENQTCSAHVNLKFIRRRASLGCALENYMQMGSGSFTRIPSKPIKEKVPSQPIESESPTGEKSFFDDRCRDESASPSRACGIDRRPGNEDATTSSFRSKERNLTDRDLHELPIMSKKADVSKSKRSSPLKESSFRAISPTLTLSPLTSPRAVRFGARPIVQKLCSSLDEPDSPPPRSDEAGSEDRSRRGDRPGKSSMREGMRPAQMLDPLIPASLDRGESSELGERQRRALSRKGSMPKIGVSDLSGQINLQIQSPNTSPPGNIVKKFSKATAERLSSPIDASLLASSNSGTNGELMERSIALQNGVMGKAESLLGDFWEHNNESNGMQLESAYDLPSTPALGGSHFSAEKTRFEVERINGLSRSGSQTSNTPEADVSETLKANILSLATSPTSAASDDPEAEAGGSEEQDHPRRRYSSSYRLPSRASTKSDSQSPLSNRGDQDPDSDIDKSASSNGPQFLSGKSKTTDSWKATISPADEMHTGHVPLQNDRQDLSLDLSKRHLGQSEDPTESEQARITKSKIKELESKLRKIIAKQDEDKAQEHAEVAELGRQFAAACKLIENMKKQLQVLTEENVDLRNRLANTTANAEELASKSDNALQEKSTDISDANKKVRLAQEQMAKLIARHTKEIANWTSNCEDLRREAANVRAFESTARKEIDMLQQTVKKLEEKRKDKVSKAGATQVDATTQTNRSNPRGDWDSWIWLVSLAVWTSNKPRPLNSIEIQTDLSLESSFKPRVKDVAVMTMQETLNPESDWDRWWLEVLDSAEEELKILKCKGKTLLSRPQILSVIANIYAEKIVQDEVDDRESLPRVQLTSFLHMFFLDQKGCAQAAQSSIVNVIANILAHLRGQNNRHRDHPGSEDISLWTVLKTNGLSGKCSRIVLFARFLGLKHEGLEPIPVEGLSLFLASLAKASKGQLPLLPMSEDKVLIPSKDYIQILDWIFNQSRAITRETVKVGLLNIKTDPIDLEVALEYTLDQWKDCEAKNDARLEALFSTVVAVADFSFEIFNEMMQKLKVDEPILPAHSSRLRMFQELCTYPRVDSSIFSKIARKYGIFKFNFGSPPGMTKLDVDGSASFDSLEPLYATALKTISAKLPELDQLGHGRGLERKWGICGQLLKERESPEKAWIFYYTVTRMYSASMRQIRSKGDKGPGAGVIEPVPTEASNAAKKIAPKEKSFLTRLPSNS